jgi:hypothetical protein
MNVRATQTVFQNEVFLYFESVELLLKLYIPLKVHQSANIADIFVLLTDNALHFVFFSDAIF